MLKTQHMALYKKTNKKKTVMVHKSTDQTFAVPEKTFSFFIYC